MFGWKTVLEIPGQIIGNPSYVTDSLIIVNTLVSEKGEEIDSTLYLRWNPSEKQYFIVIKKNSILYQQEEASTIHEINVGGRVIGISKINGINTDPTKNQIISILRFDNRLFKGQESQSKKMFGWKTVLEIPGQIIGDFTYITGSGNLKIKTLAERNGIERKVTLLLAWDSDEKQYFIINKEDRKIQFLYVED